MKRLKHHSHHLPVTAWMTLLLVAFLFAAPWLILVINEYSHWVAGFAR